MVKYINTKTVAISTGAWGLGEVLTTPSRENTMLRNINEMR
jgi:hypothetical protein